MRMENVFSPSLLCAYPVDQKLSLHTGRERRTKELTREDLFSPSFLDLSFLLSHTICCYLRSMRLFSFPSPVHSVQSSTLSTLSTLPRLAVTIIPFLSSLTSRVEEGASESLSMTSVYVKNNIFRSFSNAFPSDKKERLGGGLLLWS